MRKKMVKNELFYVHYPYRPEVEGGENVNNFFPHRIFTVLISQLGIQ